MKFGECLRGYRLGFRLMEGVGFVRIRAGGPPWQVNICPPGKLVARCCGGAYLAWWEGDVTTIRATIKAQVDHEVTEPLILMLDDDGRTVKPAD